MQKLTKQIPIYEEVQTGTQDAEVWVTSDGNEFYDKRQAQEHEFRLEIKIREICLPYLAHLFYFKSQKQVSHWIENYDKNYNEMLFDGTEFQYPGWFVIHVSDNEGEYDDYIASYEMKTLGEYKIFLADKLDELTK